MQKEWQVRGWTQISKPEKGVQWELRRAYWSHVDDIVTPRESDTDYFTNGSGNSKKHKASD